MLGGMFGAKPWQNRYALPDWKSLLTNLAPSQEQAFKQWVLAHRAPITDDYDMRGFWLHGAEGAQVNPNDRMMHYPDTYKTPLHESFSAESLFANPAAHPPRWNNRDQLVGQDGTVLFDERRRR